MLSSTVTIYGIPLEEVHDKSLGPILESREDYPYIGILYCGFKAGNNEIRLPSDRLWYFKKSDVEDTGMLEDFQWEEKKVHYYDLDLKTSIYEKFFQEVQFGAEISLKPRTFAGKVVVPPERAVSPEQLKEMTREELENLVARQIEMPGEGGPDGCTTWYQTYSETRYDPWSRRDPWGADCD